jgi:hypothetical protein
MQIINIIAIALSPIIAVLVSIWIQYRREKNQRKFQILGTLIATRYNPILDDNVKALNLIDIIFHNKPNVRKLWHEYYDLLSNESLSNPSGYELRQKKNWELIAEMAKSLGYGKEFSHLDTARVYNPIALSDQAVTAYTISQELIRIFKSGGDLQVFINQKPVSELSSQPKNDQQIS